uniref:trichohyalin-like n=1 Tax=Styela clava TaxID=7725 RepID=UPI00193A9746|nr:trichohyalin-like [Styela clava]
MEILIQQLKEQVAMLTAYLKEERDKHVLARENLNLDHQNEIRKLSEEHNVAVCNLERKHENYVCLLKSHHKSILNILEKTLQDRIKRLRNECALLQAALRNYKEVVRSDMGKVWSEKEECLRLENDEKISETVRKAKMIMEREFEIEKIEMRKSFEAEMNKNITDAVNKILSSMINDTRSGSELGLIESFQAMELDNQLIDQLADQDKESRSNALIENDNIHENEVTKEGSSLNVLSQIMEQSDQVEIQKENYDGEKTLENQILKEIIEEELGVIGSDTLQSSSDTPRDSEIHNLILENLSDDEVQ